MVLMQLVFESIAESVYAVLVPLQYSFSISCNAACFVQCNNHVVLYCFGCLARLA